MIDEDPPRSSGTKVCANSAREYARGDVHTNTAESSFALVNGTSWAFITMSAENTCTVIFGFQLPRGFSRSGRSNLIRWAGPSPRLDFTVAEIYEVESSPNVDESLMDNRGARIKEVPGEICSASSGSGIAIAPPERE